ncbi:MAG: hypothetical protein O7G31_01260 [Calditrichaeota bacterium]|nr:hypothetical protein [Calditrichota bacterium]
MCLKEDEVGLVLQKTRLLPLVDITLDNIPRSRAPGDQGAVATGDVVDNCHVVAGMIAAVALGDPSS